MNTSPVTPFPPTSPTGRAMCTVPKFQRLKGSASFGPPLNPRQREVLAMLVDDKLEVHGRTFTRSELLCIFSGQQIPKDMELCKFLGLHLFLSDYSKLEERAMLYMKD